MMSELIAAVVQMGPFRKAVAVSVHPHHKGGLKLEAGDGSVTIESLAEAEKFHREVSRVVAGLRRGSKAVA